MISLVAEIPGYLQGRNPSCIEAVTRRLAKMLKLPLELQALREESTAWELAVSQAMEDDKKLAKTIRTLEEAYDDELIAREEGGDEQRAGSVSDVAVGSFRLAWSAAGRDEGSSPMTNLGPHPAFLASHFASAGAASTTAHSDTPRSFSISSVCNAQPMAEADILERSRGRARIGGRNP